MEVAPVQSAMPASDDARFAVSIRALREAGAVVSERRDEDGRIGLDVGFYFPPVEDHQLRAIENVPDIRWLRVLSTKLTDRGMSHLANLRQLRLVSLECDRLSDAGLAYLENFDGLIGLRVEAAVDGSFLRQLRCSDTLRWLTLNSPRLIGAELRSLRSFTKLRSLQILGSVHDEDVSELACLPLEELSLGNTDLSNAGLGALGAMRDLTTFRLVGTQVSDAACIPNLGGLRRLDIEGVPMNDAGLRGLRRAERLEVLLVSQMDIGDLGMSEVALLTNLSSLSLYDVPISSAMLASLKKLPNLRSLVISGAVLADEALSRITGLRQLERLQLDNVAGSRTVLHQIQALPNLKQLKLTPATTHEDAVRQRHPGDFDARQ